MTLFASNINRGFYDSTIHDVLPDDATEISVELYNELLAGQSAGSTIVWNDEGLPTLQAPAVATLAEKQAAAWEAIKAKRDAKTQLGGFKVGSNWFHSDTFSRSQHIALVIMDTNIPAGLTWKTMSGDFVPMTKTLAQSIFAAGAAKDQATFTAAEVHNTAMLACDDPDEYDFSAGWPECYTPAE